MRGAAAPLATIDVGSNTVHLLVALPKRDGHELKPLADEAVLVRLGADVAANGVIGPERAERALAAIEAQAATARRLGARHVLGIATEGVRAAGNGARFLAEAQARSGVSFALVTGHQEAALTFWGATSSAPASYEHRAVVDLGGGSLEVVIGEGMRVGWRVSLPLGVGPLHVRYAPADPPLPRQLYQVHQVVGDAVRAAAPPLPVHEVAVCGGTVTALRVIARRAPEVAHLSRAYARARQSALRPRTRGTAPRRFRYLTREHLHALLAVVQAHPAASLAERYGVSLARAPLLPVGCMALLTLLEELNAPRLRVSRQGMREGALLALAQAGDDWLALAERGAGLRAGA